jgi:hypothetical protein
MALHAGGRHVLPGQARLWTRSEAPAAASQATGRHRRRRRSSGAASISSAAVTVPYCCTASRSHQIDIRKLCSELGGAMEIRTPDLLHAIENPLGSLACCAPSGSAAAAVTAPACGRHGSGCGLRRSRLRLRPAAVNKRGRLQDAASGQSASANSHGHGHLHAVQARLMTLTAYRCHTGRRSNDGQMIFPACPAEPGMTS